jgi:hypothetical protein
MKGKMTFSFLEVLERETKMGGGMKGKMTFFAS